MISMPMMRALAVFAVLLSPLKADAAIWPKPTPEAQGAAVMMDGRTIVTLSATEQQEVSQDRLSATLTINHEGRDPATVQAYINEKMRDAVKKAENTSGVKVATGGYQVYKTWYDPNPAVNGGKDRPAKWQGNQALTLDSANAEALLTLSGEIQKMGFATEGLNYYLSREKAESLKDELIARALDTIRARSNNIAKQLGMGKVQFAQVNFDGPPVMVQPKMMRMAMAAGAEADMAAPVAKAGESSVSVTVNVVVILAD